MVSCDRIMSAMATAGEAKDPYQGIKKQTPCRRPFPVFGGAGGGGGWGEWNPFSIQLLACLRCLV